MLNVSLNYSMIHFEDLINDFNELPIFPEVMPFDPQNRYPVPDEVASLNSRLEQLSIDVHTQSLRVAIKCAKRQILGTMIRKIKSNVISPKKLYSQTQYDNDHFHRRLTGLQQEYSHKLVQITTVTYRSLARVHQLMIIFTPYIRMTMEAHANVSQLNYELYRAIEQLKPQIEAT